MSQDLPQLMSSLATHRFSLMGGTGTPFINRAINEVDPTTLAKAFRDQFASGPTGRRRTSSTAYGAFSAIVCYWTGMLSFSRKTAPWQDPPPLILALRDACLELLWQDPYFASEEPWGETSFCLELAPLAAARRDDLLARAAQQLRQIHQAGGVAAQDAAYALRALHLCAGPEQQLN